MNRMQACLVALLLSGLAMTMAHAANIDVTTTADIVADNDELCSLREAVAASVRATTLVTHGSNQTSFTQGSDALKSEIDGRLQFSGEYYPRGTIQTLLSAMRAELEAQTPPAGAETDARDEILQQVIDLAMAIDDLPDDKVYLCSDTSTPVCTAFDLPPDPYHDDPHSVKPGVLQVYDLTLLVLEQVEAEIERLEARNEADGCQDGSSFDRINLGEDTYILDSELLLDSRADLVGVGDDSIVKPNPAGPQNYRLLRIERGRTISMFKLQLQGGRATTDGGAILVEGSLNLSDALLVDNTAQRDGGALYVGVSGSLDLERVRFFGNSAVRDGGAVAGIGGLEMEDVTFGEDVTGRGNSAVFGGALFFNPHVLSDPQDPLSTPVPAAGVFSLDRGAFVNNEAQTGSALYVGIGSGTADAIDARVMLANVTFGRNDAAVGGTGAGATLAFASTSSASLRARLELNNVSMLENTSTTGPAGLRVVYPSTVIVDNTVIAGNMTGAVVTDCDFSGWVSPVAPDDINFQRNYYYTGSACPGLRYDSVSAPTNTNYELPVGETIGYLVAFDSTQQLYVPVYPDDVDSPTENRLVNRGASSQEAFRCAEVDQRNLERQSFVDADCDIGAIEYQTGRRADDAVTVMVNETACLVVKPEDDSLPPPFENIIENDIGDSQYIVRTLEVLGIERAGARAVIASTDPAQYIADYQARHATTAVPDVVDIATCPNFAELPVGTTEAILYTPPRGFYGETNLTYGLLWSTDAAIAGAPVYPLASTDFGSVSSIAHVSSESRGGFKSSTIGAWGPAVVLLALLALRRRTRFLRIASAALALLFASGSAQALENIIYVNSDIDTAALQTVPGDGLCTLREALETARNDQANLTRGDCLNGNEGPDIIEFVPELTAPANTTVQLEETLTSYGGVTIRCSEPVLISQTASILSGLVTTAGTYYENTGNASILVGAAGPGQVTLLPGELAKATSATTAIVATRPFCAITRLSTDPAFALINSLGSLTIENMLLENGDAGSGNDGGAINSAGSVLIENSVFRYNRARIGGAVFMRGRLGDLAIIDSRFHHNGLPPAAPAPTVAGTCNGSLSEGGGTIGMATGQHKVQVTGSAFLYNWSLARTAAIDVQTSSSAVIANSTFSGNISCKASGALGLTGSLSSSMLRNLTVVDNRSNPDELVDVSASRYAVEFGSSGGHRLVNSVVSSNYGPASGDDRNCTPDPFITIYDTGFNLYGESTSTCRVGATDQVLAANTVYDGTTAGYLLPLAFNGARTETHAPDVLKPAVFGTIVDAGYNLDPVPNRNLIDSLDIGSPKCSTVDQRGKSREAGGRCDIGAYENEVITAVPDSASNVGRRDRVALSDILGNDIAPVGQRCVPDTVSGEEVSPLGGNMRQVRAYVDATDTDCAIVTFDMRLGQAFFLPLVASPTEEDPQRRFVDDNNNGTREEPEPYTNTDSTFMLAYRDCNEDRSPVTAACNTPSTPVITDEDDDNDGDGDGDDWFGEVIKSPVRIIEYQAGDLAGNLSQPSDISIAIGNVPPRLLADEVSVPPGVAVTIDILANDIDYDQGIDPPPLSCTPSNTCTNPVFDYTKVKPLSATGLDVSSLKITSATCEDETDVNDRDADGDLTEKYYRCQFGDVFLDNVKTVANPNPTGRLTWFPRNSFNPFTETLTYQVSDYAYPQSDPASATVVISIDRPEANGGSMLGDDDLSDLLGIDFLGAAGNFLLFVLGITALRRRAA